MKSFLGLGSTAWVASAVVHVGLAGGYALAPATGMPTPDVPLVIELIMEEQPSGDQPAEAGISNGVSGGASGEVDTSDIAAREVEVSKAPIQQQSILQDTPDLAEPEPESEPEANIEPEQAPVKPAAVEIQVAIATPQEKFPSPTITRDPAPEPVVIEAPVPTATRPTAEAQPDFPHLPTPLPEAEIVFAPVPDFEVPVEVALAPVVYELPQPSLIPEQAYVPEPDPVKVWLPREKPQAPQRPEPVDQASVDRLEETQEEPFEELTLDQIASAAITVEEPEPETPEPEISEPDIPEPVEVSPDLPAETTAEVMEDLQPETPVITETRQAASSHQVASLATPVVVRADRLRRPADPKAVARVKGRGAFSQARALPVGKVNPKPKYPYSARKRGYEGRIVLHIRISAEGNPVDVNVVSGTGFKVLDKAAVAAVMRWRFEAARRAGVRVAGTVVTPIVFRLDN